MKLFFFIFCCISLLANAQQEPQFTHFNRNILLVNPASAGLQYDLVAGLFVRDQWTGLNGAPFTMGFSGASKIAAINSGVGLTYYYDEIGFEKNNVIQLNYAYHLPIGIGHIGLGISPKIHHKNIDLSAWTTPNTPVINPVETNDLVVDMGLGAFWKSEYLQVGLSVTNLIESNYTNAHVQGVRHYYAYGQYDIDFGPSFTLSPAVFGKSDMASSQLDVLLTGTYQNTYWLQSGYRTSDIVTVGGGARIIDKFEVGYAYDFPTNQINHGSHEIVLRLVVNGNDN